MTEIATLPHLSTIVVSGPDAAAFLQGQCTCDVREVNRGRSRPGALCNAQGRVIATVRLLQAGEGYCLVLNQDMVDRVLRRLTMYVLRAKVSLNKGDWALYGLISEGMDSALAELGVLLPPESDSAARTDSRMATRIPGTPARCLLLAKPEASTAWPKEWTELSEQAWRLADIASGLPDVGAPLTEQFVPQMLNLDAIGAVSFTKGCYTGQEVVARAHYLGQVKRRLYRFSLAQASLPQPGDTIVAPGQEETVGVVVAAAEHGGRRELLAVIATGQAENDLRLGKTGATLTHLPLRPPS